MAFFLVSCFRKKTPADKTYDTLAMYDSLCKDNTDEIVYIRENNYDIIYVNNEKECATQIWKDNQKDISDPLFIYIIGWCYRINALNERLKNQDFHEFLDRHRRGLPPASEEFSGNYVILVYDAKTQRVIIQPDHWSMGSIYFSVSEGGIVASNRSIAVASFVSASLDGYSILSLMRGTHMPFGRSLFSGVRRVMCGNYLEINLNTVSINRKSDFQIYSPVQNLSFKQSLESVIEGMAVMADRLIQCKSTLFDLTGGNDTRLTAAAISSKTLNTTESKLSWRVVGSESDPDVLIAGRIAQICNWNLLQLARTAPSDASTRDLEKVILRSDGTCLVDSAFTRVRQETAYRGEWDWLVGSIGGELLRGFFWRHEMLSLGRSQRVNYTALLIYRLYASKAVSSILFGRDAPTLQEHDEILLEPYRQIDDLGQGLLNPYKLDRMYLHKLCYSAGNTYSWLVGLRNIRLPLLSWEFTRLILSIPWQFRANRSLMTSAIERMNPVLAQISNDRNEPMTPLNFFTLIPYLKVGLSTVATTIPRVFRRYAKSYRSSPPVSLEPPVDSWLAIINEPRHIDSIFDRSIVKNICSEAASPSRTRDLMRLFYTLLTLELLFCEVPRLRKRVDFSNNGIG